MTGTMTPTDDPLPRAKPLERYPQLETDTFCVECGYNLHSQPVTRDERLGIFVCRCPECGRFHPAGTGITAAASWMSRLASIALVAWLVVVLFAIFWLCIGIGAVYVVHVEEFSYRRQIASDGREVVWSNVPGKGTVLVYRGTTQPATSPRPHRTVRATEWPDEEDQYGRNLEWRRQQVLIGGTILGLSDLGLGLVSGVLLVTFFWHWPRRRYPFVLLLPFAVGAVVVAVMFMDDDYERVRGWMISRVFMHAALQALFMYVGIRIGRPIARLALRVFIPPKPRQHFAFLWRADGKRVPPATTPTPT